MANAINVVSNGPGQETYGLTWNWSSTKSTWGASGLGLVTNGFLWLCADIWSDDQATAQVTWTSDPCSSVCSE